MKEFTVIFHFGSDSVLKTLLKAKGVEALAADIEKHLLEGFYRFEMDGHHYSVHGAQVRYFRIEP